MKSRDKRRRVKQYGEVFTPPELVEEMLDKFPDEIWDASDKTWLDNSCGNGNFLVAVRDRLLQRGHSLENALSRIYGVDIQQWCVDECRERMDPDNAYPDIMERNIVCADALKYHYRFDGSPPYDPEPPPARTGKFADLFPDK